MRAIILAGGFGKRLQATVPHLPKPMVPIQGKPFLAYLLTYLHKMQISSVIFSLHYQADVIQNYFGQNYLGMKIDYAIEAEPLGTGGAIRHALQLFPSDQSVFVINGDTFAILDYLSMYAQHQRNESSFTVALSTVPDCTRYGNILIDEKKSVIGFSEKGTSGSGFINAGIYLIQPDLFAYYQLSAQFSLEYDFILKHLEILKPQAFIASDYFIDIGIAADYQRAQTEIPQLMHL